MPVENTGQYLTRLLLFAALQLIARHRPRHICAAGDKLRPQRLQPVAQRGGGIALVLIVGKHRALGLFSNRRGIIQFQIRLEIGQCDIRIGKRGLARLRLGGSPRRRLAHCNISSTIEINGVVAANWRGQPEFELP